MMRKMRVRPDHLRERSNQPDLVFPRLEIAYGQQIGSRNLEAFPQPRRRV